MSVLGQAALGSVAIGASKTTAATGPITIQMVGAAGFTASVPAITASEQVNTTAVTTTYSSPPNSLQFTANPPAATTTYAAVATASEQLNTVPSTVTFSTGVVGAAIAPKIPTAMLTTFSTGTNTLQESLTATPGSVTYNVGNTTGSFVLTSSVSSVVFSNGANSASFNVASPASTTTFSTGAEKVTEIVSTIAALTTYSAQAVIPGLTVIVTAVPATFTASVGTITAARVAQTTPGQVTYNVAATVTEVLNGIPGSVSYSGGPNNSIGNSVTAVPVTATYSVPPAKLLNSITSTSTVAFDILATVTLNLQAQVTTTTYDSPPPPVGFFVNSTAGNVVFSIPSVTTFYKSGDIPGSIFVSVLTNSIRVSELRNGINVMIEKNRDNVQIECDKSLMVVEKNKELVTNG